MSRKKTNAPLPPAGQSPREGSPYPTAAEAIRRIDAFEDLKPARRAALGAAVSFLARAAGEAAEACLLTPETCRRILRKASAEALRITRSSLATYRTNARAALRLLRVIDCPHRPRVPLPPEWA